MKPLSYILLSFSLLLALNSEYAKPVNAQQKVDPESFDFELLETTLLSKIEKRRPKLNTTTFRTTNQLSKISETLLEKYSFGYIKYAMRKNRLSKRKWSRVVDQGGFKGTYSAVAITSAPLYDFPKKAKVYYDKSDLENPFYYKQWKKQVALSTYTYESLVDKLLNNAAFSDSRKLLRSKGLSEIGYAFRLEDRGEGKMPYISVAITAGGYRLQRLNDLNKEKN